MNAYAPRAYTILGVDSMQTEMAAPLHLAPVGDKAVDLDFDGGLLSSDAGLMLLKDPDEQLGLTRALAAVLKDARIHAGSTFPCMTCSNNACYKLPRVMKMPTTPTPYATILSSSCSSIVCRIPVPPWRHNRHSRGSKTMSHAPNSSVLARVLVEQFITSYARPPQLIVLDFDDTEDPVHGEQEQARYDGYYGGYCFLPLHPV